MYGGKVRAIVVEEPGSFTECEMTPAELEQRYTDYFGD